MNASTTIRQTDLRLTGAMTMMPPALPTCAVRLIDRRTNAAHRVNGSPLTIYTKNPVEAAADLLRGRDPDLWEARVETLREGTQ